VNGCQVLFFYIFVIFLPPASLIAQIRSEQGTPYRVGIVAYDDIKGRASVMTQCFSAIGHDLRFASGTAEEVLDWISDGLVDIAVVSPGALAATGAVLRKQERNGRTVMNQLPAWDCRYLITPELPPSTSPFASTSRRSGPSYVYESLCLVNKGSFEKLQHDFPGTIEETIRNASRANRVQFVFGDPLSLSGTIVPKAQLKRMGIQLGRCWEFSFGHKDTISLLLEEPEPELEGQRRVRVGFVYDASIPEAPASYKGDKALWQTNRVAQIKRDLTTVQLPRPEEPSTYVQFMASKPQTARSQADALNDLPGEVWVVRPDFGAENTERLRADLLSLSGKGFGFRDQNDPNETPNAIDLLAARVQHWSRVAEIDLGGGMSTRPIGFSEIVHSMRHYSRRYGEPSRLALVLSGGGAKCAYQAGAIDSIEDQLYALRDFRVSSPLPSNSSGKPLERPDISLVVGTSGGALNALPTAVGITAAGRDHEQKRLASIWSTIQLTDFFCPSWRISVLLGGLLATLLSFLTWLGVAAGRFLRRRSTTDNKGLLILRWFLVAALVAFAVAQRTNPGYIRLAAPPSRVAYYLLWLPIYLSAAWAAVILALITGANQWRQKRYRSPAASFELALWRGLILPLAAAAILTLSALFLDKSLSGGDEMQKIIVAKILRILGNQVHPNMSKLGGADQQITALSAAIADESQGRQRDLVMTVSLLGGNRNADRYAYLPAIKGEPAPSYERRAVQLQRGGGLNFIEDPKLIVSLMIASGTIFPIFPAKAFVDPTGVSEDLYVVDGGFAHNIPIEAAVDWGATHVIVIEASPWAIIRQRQSFVANVGSAFDHLFAQAQLTDVRSRGKLEVFTLRPRQELLKTLDFIPSLIDKAIQQGRQDVDAGRFIQISRPPRLLQLSEM
jgi:predicted acylesterase/phospholipase RssA